MCIYSKSDELVFRVRLSTAKKEIFPSNVNSKNSEEFTLKIIYLREKVISQTSDNLCSSTYGTRFWLYFH